MAQLTYQPRSRSSQREALHLSAPSTRRRCGCQQWQRSRRQSTCWLACERRR